MKKNITEIEQEYQDYERKSTYVESLEDFHIYTEIGIDEAKENVASAVEEIRLNCKDQFAAKVRNFFLSMFQIEEVDYYNADNAVLEEVIAYVTAHMGYFQKVQGLATDENFTELTRLLDFLCEYYNEQMDFFESQRDALEFQVKGFCFQDSRYADNSEAIAEFFNKEISKYSATKTVEKTKKMW